jgi:hypothetical protein
LRLSRQLIQNSFVGANASFDVPKVCRAPAEPEVAFDDRIFCATVTSDVEEVDETVSLEDPPAKSSSVIWPFFVLTRTQSPLN